MGSRTWIKIYCDRWLNGTIREETPEIRGIWVDLLVLAGSGKYGDSGEIKITDHVGFLDEQLADLLQISRQKWVTIKKKLMQTDRVIVKNNNIIAIKKWSKYQSEYERQRQYHQLGSESDTGLEKCNKILQPDVTTEAVIKDTARERDKRLEKETIERDTPLNPPVSQFSETEVIGAYEENILLGGTINEEMEYELKVACGRYSSAWVMDAIKEALAQNQPTWRYIVGILRNWAKERRGKSLQSKDRVKEE